MSSQNDGTIAEQDINDLDVQDNTTVIVLSGEVDVQDEPPVIEESEGPGI